ncbi:cysteine-rich RLK (RECEPTOR-like protein kinase)18 [Striga asiatica]|uniref:Cysteine-rich RLK (RECEPTOR-like protein kinase)18 n=1 Tax=Striga asiatica TaxID=4170 RepID=A0A5A7PFU8_STRAF|nr:cysteine-rich RLK (RECEPTOR-like protein kinase)18 [Striga asiatica]
MQPKHLNWASPASPPQTLEPGPNFRPGPINPPCTHNAPSSASSRKTFPSSRKSRTLSQLNPHEHTRISCNASSGLPFLPYPSIIEVHEKTFLIGIRSKIRRA